MQHVAPIDKYLQLCPAWTLVSSPAQVSNIIAVTSVYTQVSSMMLLLVLAII